MTKPTLAFIGAGTLGTALSRALVAADYRVVAVHSRLPNDTTRLAEMLPDAIAVGSSSEVVKADLIFLTVPDDAIRRVCDSVAWPARCSVVHCSGALSLDVLDHAASGGAAVGSLHPLQTFAGGGDHVRRLTDIAYALEASTEGLRATLDELVLALGGRCHWIRGQDKPLYHASAAMASNYLVALLGDASKLWESLGMSRETGLHSLLPLVKGTVENLQGIGFPDALTGPIARGDIETVRIHIQALTASQPAILRSYVAMGMRTIAMAIEKGTLRPEAGAALRALLDSVVLTDEDH